MGFAEMVAIKIEVAFALNHYALIAGDEVTFVKKC